MLNLFAKNCTGRIVVLWSIGYSLQWETSLPIKAWETALISKRWEDHICKRRHRIFSQLPSLACALTNYERWTKFMQLYQGCKSMLQGLELNLIYIQNWRGAGAVHIVQQGPQVYLDCNETIQHGSEPGKRFLTNLVHWNLTNLACLLTWRTHHKLWFVRCLQIKPCHTIIHYWVDLSRLAISFVMLQRAPLIYHAWSSKRSLFLYGRPAFPRFILVAIAVYCLCAFLSRDALCLDLY